MFLPTYLWKMWVLSTYHAVLTSKETAVAAVSAMREFNLNSNYINSKRKRMSHQHHSSGNSFNSSCNAIKIVKKWTMCFRARSEVLHWNIVDNINNLPTAKLDPQIIRDKLTKELKLERILDPFKEPPFQDLMCSLVGLVPKKDTDEMHMILHLSYP